MRDLTKQFSIQEISEVATENSKEFAIARIAVLSTRPNSHRIIITDEILRRDGLSVLGKWVVCSFNGIDATSHKIDEVIVGCVPKDAKYEFIETEDGYTVMYVEAIISKLYAKNVYELFKLDNKRNVSVEMLTANDIELPNGDIEIDGLEITGITILGKSVKGSCPDANMQIIKFSEEEAENYYHEFSQHKSSDLELAIRNLVDVVLTNKEFSQDENQETKETQMKKEEIEIFEESAKEEDVIMEETQECAAPETQDEEDKAEMAEDSKDEETQDDEKEMAEESDDKEDEEEADDKEMSCGEKDEEMSCDKSMSEENADNEEKTFSLRENIEAEVFEALDENVKEFAEKLVDMSAVEILNEAIRLFSEVKELGEYKNAVEDEKREKKFASIMASVKEDLDEKTFAELSEEGKEISLNELGAFENKVKATAFEQSKSNVKKDADEPEIMVFAGNDNISNVENLDVFERISRA